MGSLTSRPKAPPRPAPPTSYVMTVPSYSPPPPPAPAPEKSPDPAAAEKSKAVSAGLLERRRGILSTVLTGFRGVLDPRPAAARKTLLGE